MSEYVPCIVPPAMAPLKEIVSSALTAPNVIWSPDSWPVTAPPDTQCEPKMATCPERAEPRSTSVSVKVPFSAYLPLDHWPCHVPPGPLTVGAGVGCEGS